MARNTQQSQRTSHKVSRASQAGAEEKEGDYPSGFSELDLRIKLEVDDPAPFLEVPLQHEIAGGVRLGSDYGY
jgi:hypothetical protein